MHNMYDERLIIFTIYSLNQAQWPTWFLKIDSVQIVGMHVFVCVCPPPRLLITSDVMWHDMKPI